MFASFLAPQILLNRKRSCLKTGLRLRFLMRPPGGAGPFGTEPLCVAGEAAVALGDGRMSQPPGLPAQVRPSLPARPRPARGLPPG